MVFLTVPASPQNFGYLPRTNPLSLVSSSETENVKASGVGKSLRGKRSYWSRIRKKFGSEGDFRQHL